MIRSLRFRLLLGATFCGGVILALLSAGIYIAMHHALLRDFDQSLDARAQILEAMIDVGEEGPSFRFDAAQLPDFVSKESGSYFEIWQSNGRVLARSPSLGGADLPRLDVPENIPTRCHIPGAGKARALLLNFVPRPDADDPTPASPLRPVQIMVAAQPSEASHALELLAWFEAILCGAAIVLMGLVLLKLVNQNLVPVQRLAATLESLGEADLTTPLPRRGMPSELLPVVDKLNGLLARIDAVVGREKCFTADVSHELRTPLAGLRTTLEVCRSRPRPAAEYESAVDDCLVLINRMEAMVNSLLLLARSEAGRLKINPTEVDLSKLIRQGWSILEHRANQRQLSLAFENADRCLITTDRELLGVVLQNVLDNAVSHADEGGRITVCLKRAGNFAELAISNTGSRVDPADVPRLLERFTRGDESRSETGIHTGLGLALCKRLMAILGGEITIQTQNGGDFTVRLQLPSPNNLPDLKSAKT